MPLPEPSEQDCESLRAGQEPSVGARKPQESSNLVPARDKERPKPTDVASQETSSTATLPNNTLQVAPVKKQGRIIHRKRSRVDAVPPQPLEFLKTPFGGRLLVHKSFLYKQEKAVGDKVYWKCRQHSELSCRGRAITRGFRVTEMRDHCHPPEKEGLDRKKRHRGRPPSSALPEGAEVQEDEVSLWLYPVEPEPTPQPSIETPEEEQGYRSLALQSLPPKKRPTPGVVRYRPLEFLKTCYGGTFLVHQSFLYKREKTVGGKVYWTCREHAVHGCRSRAITQGQRVTVMRSHCHSPDIEGLQARRQQEKTIKKIQARRIGAGDLEDCDDIEDSLLQGVDSLFYRRGQGTLTLSRSKSKSKSKSRSKSKSKSRSRSRKRAKKQQESSQEPPEEDQDVDPRGPEFLKTPLGGNFLVYESFLYRREKVAGEKVYWTCRDQARMGCRSRAITQGRQVTVMRSHCHPPDLLGLETLRQREKRPGPSQWDGPEGPEFLKTPLGGSFLVYESFLYRREKATGDKVYWTCRDQARMGCRSRAITQGQRVMVMRRHCHPPDMGGLEALRQRENFPNLTHWEGPEPLQPLEFLRDDGRPGQRRRRRRRWRWPQWRRRRVPWRRRGWAAGNEVRVAPAERGAMGRAGTGDGSAAVSGLFQLLLLPLLLAWAPPAASGDSTRSDVRLVSELFSQSPQQLSFYSWYGSARLFHFRVPPDTVLLRWLLHVSRGGGPLCSDVEITVHFRSGAPPVINPLNTSFPEGSSVPPSFRVRVLQGNTSVNVSHPAPGDWFLAAHLPPSPQKIQMKGFVPSCAYVFQPDMLVLRAVEVLVLEPDVPLPQILLPSRPSYLKVFVPEFTQELLLELRDCASNGSQACPVHLAVGSVTLPGDFRRVLSCAGHSVPCRLLLLSPPWDRWLQVTAESLAGSHVMVVFSAVATLTACRPWTVSTQHLQQASPNRSCNAPDGPRDPVHSSGLGSISCLLSYPVLREDVDVVSVRFRPWDRVSVLVRPDLPSVLRLYLSTGMDSGGSLIISLQANKTTVKDSALVVACVNAASAFLGFNTSHDCTTAFFQGYPLILSITSWQANLVVPFPETENWYLSLQLMCPENPEECERASVHVETTLHLVPCVNDCGPHGQCLLLRRHGYLYAGCSCKAGWRGWSCSDNSTAQTLAQQTVAALLLTLSNLVFLAPVGVSLRRAFLVEACVYAYTMFFSTFYHACDQPGEAVLCILDYDTLQYCDFLGSVVSVWVTILCMARLKPVLKYVLYLLGTLVIAMSLQLDRRGAWNMMGPCLCALVTMVSMWVYRCGRRRRCYPTSWQRWACYLLPGISMATVAVAIYTSMMTSDNYYYTHSLWHMLVAASAALLLPPREEHTEAWACLQRLPCRYQICRDDREELYTVT